MTSYKNSDQTIGHRHFMLYKPYGFLSQFISNSKDEQKKRFLGDLYNFPKCTMAIGRLDEKSEGLLILTTDGVLSAKITGHNIEKEYYAQLDGDINANALEQLKKGVEIGFKGLKYKTRPCTVHKITAPPNFPIRSRKIRDDRHGPTSWVSITLTEGKFRQVRKMTSAVGFPTLRLVRVRIGNLHLKDLQIGEVKELTQNYFKGLV